MPGRVAVAACVAGLLLSFAAAGWGRSAVVAAHPAVSVPLAGNVTVARLVLASTAKGSTPLPPRLTLASRGTIRAGGYVVAGVAPDRTAGRFVATVAVIRPGQGPFPGQRPEPTRSLTLRVPPGFDLVGPVQVAANVLYQNPTPSFGLAPTGTTTLLAGPGPAKLPLARALGDAQLLALDRNAPLADMGLLGLAFVTAGFSGAGTTVRVTIGLAGLSQVNAVELRFPANIRVTGVAGPQATSGVLLGDRVQLIASSAFFQQGLPYRFTLRLSRAPRQAEFVTLRASEHYFESSLPFVERFALG